MNKALSSRLFKPFSADGMDGLFDNSSDGYVDNSFANELPAADALHSQLDGISVSFENGAPVIVDEPAFHFSDFSVMTPTRADATSNQHDGLKTVFADLAAVAHPNVLGVQSGLFGPDKGGDGLFPLVDLNSVDASRAAPLAANAAKPVATIPQLADYLVNGFWQYNGTVAHHWAITTITYNINGLTTAEKFLAQSALNAWHEVANLTFVQTTGAANITFNHNGSMTAFETDNYDSSGIITSATIDISANWITTDGGANDGKTGIDSYGYQTYIHEIGHALGLGHQGPYNGSASYSSNAIYADDTWQYSIMSYFSQQNYDGGSYRYVITPEMADIFAVVSIYGAATTRPGDTVYGFNDTAGSIFDFTAYTTAPALTIYDSGGNDTLDCSGYSAAQTIDLHAGSFSSVGGLVNNIGIAINTTIESAIGGSGNDTLIANDLGGTLKGGGGNDILTGGAGNDRLIGGAGTDSMTGGAGADVFSFAIGDSSAASGKHDLIVDFTPGTDQIDLTGIDADTSTPGIVDAFHFLATSVFDGLAAALDYFFDAVRGLTVLQGDVNGDKVADFAIDLNGNETLSAADFTTGSELPGPTPPPTALPDLTVSGLSLFDTTVSYNINDIGLASAAASTTGLYLSTDSTITKSDSLLGTFSSPALDIGGSDSESISLSLPTNLRAGTYYLGVIADKNGQVAESSETNNASNAIPIIVGNSSANTLNGTTGNDTMFGLAGNDTINGGGGNDVLIGGAGKDTLTGGAGLDQFVFNATNEGLDQIKDFSLGDLIDFSHLGFGNGLAAGGADTGLLDPSHFVANATGPTNALQEFWFNMSTHTLYFDADGSGVGGQIAIAHLQTNYTLHNTDIHLV